MVYSSVPSFKKICEKEGPVIFVHLAVSATLVGGTALAYASHQATKAAFVGTLVMGGYLFSFFFVTKVFVKERSLIKPTAIVLLRTISLIAVTGFLILELKMDLIGLGIGYLSFLLTFFIGIALKKVGYGTF